MTGVRKGGVSETLQNDINKAEVRNRSISDLTEREKDLLELKKLYTEDLWCMENGDRYAEDIYDLQDYIGYCLGRTVNVIDEGIIPKRGIISEQAYGRCMEHITELLLITGLLLGILLLKDESVTYGDGMVDDV